jgi:Rrf2 family transcriptional regulator, iron-sulfur cluster assembly transcription factor
MKLITRDSDYAVRALCCIAAGKGLVSVRYLSQKLDIPYSFLRKILQALTQAGFLFSHRGRSGGFELTKPAGKISILEITKVFQGEFILTEHTFKGKMCPRVKVCKLKKQLDNIEKDVVFRLKKITLDTIIEKDDNI